MSKLEEFLKLNPIQDYEEQKPLEKKITYKWTYGIDLNFYEAIIYEDGTSTTRKLNKDEIDE